MEPDPRIAKALKLLDEAFALHARASDKMDEAKRAFQAEPSTQTAVKRLIDYYALLYKRRYSIAYVFAGAKEGGQFKRLLKQLPAEEIARRLKAYINDADEWLSEKKHPLNVFFGTVVRYGQVIDAGAQPELELAAPATGCLHKPRCQNDVQHTRKVMADMRRGGSQ